MNTIREVIKKATEIKSEELNLSYDETIQTTSLCIVVYTKNGVQLLVDMHPDHHPLKKNVYRKISFSIDKGDYNVPQEIWNYGEKWVHNNHFLAQFSGVPERLFNEFLSMNGGVNMDKFIKDFTSLWKSFRENAG